MTEHTHESDKALKLRAYSGAPWATLKDGEVLTAEERETCYELIEAQAEADDRDRYEDVDYGWDDGDQSEEA